MSNYSATVTVRCETLEQAGVVLTERTGHDEDYGFDYDIYFDVIEGVTDDFHTTVTVGGTNASEAVTVFAERFGHDEDYGFDYTIAVGAILAADAA